MATLWVKPYQLLWPEWTWVYGQDRVKGYLTCCPDTRAHEWRKTFLLTPPLFASVLLGKYGYTAETKRYLRRTLKLEKSPADRFSDEIRKRTYREYPAHLHINVHPEFHGQGLGGALIDACFEKLRANSIAGLHLDCGEKPVRFYEKVGLHILERARLPSGSEVFRMGIRF